MTTPITAYNAAVKFEDLYITYSTNGAKGPKGAEVSENEFQNNLLGAYKNLSADAKAMVRWYSVVPESLVDAFDRNDYTAYSKRASFQHYKPATAAQRAIREELNQLVGSLIGKSPDDVTSADIQSVIDRDMWRSLQYAASNGAGIKKDEVKQVVRANVKDNADGGTKNAKWSGIEKATMYFALLKLDFASPEALDLAIDCAATKAGQTPTFMR
jgi:hypothetical protein